MVLHGEAYCIAFCLAAKAVEKLLLRADGERGRFFLMKWAACVKLFAGFFDTDVRCNQLYDVDLC